MPAFLSDGNTPRRTDARWAILQKILGATVAGGGGGGGGSIAAIGANYCFSNALPNQILKLKNVDTGLSNQINSSGADGEQTVLFQDGSAC